MTANPKNVQPSDKSDEALVRLFNAGQKSAFDHLVRRHQDKIFNLCVYYLGDGQEANEISQEIFIKSYRSLGNFQFKAAFSTWLHRIAVNTCKNRLKSLEFRFKKRMRRLNLGPQKQSDPASLQIADKAGSPLRQLEQKERALQVRQAINALPDDKKTMIILRDIQELSYAEIVAITGLKTGTVKSRLARARLMLKDRLKHLL